MLRTWIGFKNLPQFFFHKTSAIRNGSLNTYSTVKKGMAANVATTPGTDSTKLHFGRNVYGHFFRMYFYISTKNQIKLFNINWHYCVS
jgi:hypothetical protein